MTKHMGVFILALLVVAILLMSTISYKLDFSENAIIKTFGKAGPPLYGANDAGLHFKWPWPVQKLVKYDARTFVFDDTYSQIQTRDKQNILVSMYCAWRIQDPRLFHSTVETVAAGQERLSTMLETYKKEVLNKQNMGELINTDPAQMRLPDIESKIAERLRSRAQTDYGIEVVGVGIRNLGLPQGVSAEVINAMKEERQRYVRQYEAAGDAQATAIRERAKAASEQILAFANREAQNIRSEGDAAAAEYYARFNENPGLSMFLRSLESLKKELKSKTVMLLDGSQLPAVKFFKDGPSLPVAGGTVPVKSQSPAAAAPAAPASPVAPVKLNDNVKTN